MRKNLTKIAMGLVLSIALVACSKEEEIIVVPVKNGILLFLQLKF